MENAVSYIKQLPETKAEIDNFLFQIKTSFLGGYENPLKLWIQFKAFETLLKSINKDEDIKDSVLNEAMKYTGTTFEAFNAQVQIKEASPKWDYHNDSVLLECEKIINECTEKKKAREKMLQSLDKPVYDEDTGEQIIPAIKISSITTLAIKLK